LGAGIGDLTAADAGFEGLERMEETMTGMIPKRAARLAVALLASTAVVAVAAGTAGATTTKTPFEVSYTYTGLTGGGFGAVSCVGTRQVNPAFASKGWATETRDVERCSSTETSHKLIALTGGETGEWFPGASGWNSDYDAKAAVTAKYVVSRNATKFRIVAYY
jgi:hypothetical protein